MIAVITLIAWLALRLLQPFVGILLWALILSVALHPAFVRLRARLGGRGGAAAVLVGLVGLAILLAPTVAAVDALSGAVSEIAERLHAGDFRLPPPAAAVRDWPGVGDWMFEAWSAAHADLEAAAAALAPRLREIGAQVARAGSALLLGVLQFAISIVLAAVFLANAEPLADLVRRMSNRIGGARAVAFAESAAATVRNVSRGVIGVALLQGALAALGFYAVGLPAAGLMSLLTVAASIVQIPALVILPAILWAWQAEPAATATLFTAWMVPVMLVDNVLKPIVMKQGLDTPMILILLGVIGGTMTAGLIGLFIGPVVLAVFYDMIRLWLEPHGNEPENPAGPAREAAE
jgi:predicted PurR-regulated permease PerM